MPKRLFKSKYDDKGDNDWENGSEKRDNTQGKLSRKRSGGKIKDLKRNLQEV